MTITDDTIRRAAEAAGKAYAEDACDSYDDDYLNIGNVTVVAAIPILRAAIRAELVQEIEAIRQEYATVRWPEVNEYWDGIVRGLNVAIRVVERNTPESEPQP